jgi:hypothetical protein
LHFSVWTNLKMRNILYFFAIGWNRKALSPWVCNLRLWNSAQMWIQDLRLEINSVDPDLECRYLYTELSWFRFFHSTPSGDTNAKCTKFK